MADKIKKLSDAIRVGCTMSRPAKGYLFDERNGETYACAFGAAYLALYGTEPVNDDDVIKRINDRILVSERTVMEVLTMNDHENRPREEIADWLEAQGL